MLTASLGRSPTRSFRLATWLLPANIGHGLLFQCASEMNQLASFRPALYEEFNGTP
jgi:hypothetical protein